MREPLGTILMVSLLGIWFLLSIVNQFHRGARIRWAIKRDRFSLIPRWTFFGPNPGVMDWNLLFRDRSVEGTLTPWREVDPFQPAPWRALWNPRKSIRKGVSDMCHALLFTMRRPGADRGLFLQVPYIALLAFVSRQSRDPLSESRQFMLLQTDGYYRSTSPRVLFVSPFHDLE